jgi:hypothetical protein
VASTKFSSFTTTGRANNAVFTHAHGLGATPGGGLILVAYENGAAGAGIADWRLGVGLFSFRAAAIRQGSMGTAAQGTMIFTDRALHGPQAVADNGGFAAYSAVHLVLEGVDGVNLTFRAHRPYTTTRNFRVLVFVWDSESYLDNVIPPASTDATVNIVTCPMDMTTGDSAAILLMGGLSISAFGEGGADVTNAGGALGFARSAADQGFLSIAQRGVGSPSLTTSMIHAGSHCLGMNFDEGGPRTRFDFLNWRADGVSLRWREPSGYRPPVLVLFMRGGGFRFDTLALPNAVQSVDVSEAGRQLKGLVALASDRAAASQGAFNENVGMEFSIGATDGTARGGVWGTHEDGDAAPDQGAETFEDAVLKNRANTISGGAFAETGRTDIGAFAPGGTATLAQEVADPATPFVVLLKWTDAAAGGAILDMAATGGGTGGGTAGLVARRAMAGTGGGTVTGTANLSAVRAMAGTGGGTVTGTAALRAYRLLQATGGGAGGGTGLLDLLAGPDEPGILNMAATGGGVGGGTGLLTVLRALSATGGGAAGGAGALQRIALVVPRTPAQPSSRGPRPVYGAGPATGTRTLTRTPQSWLS